LDASKTLTAGVRPVWLAIPSRPSLGYQRNVREKKEMNSATLRGALRRVVFVGKEEENQVKERNAACSKDKGS